MVEMIRDDSLSGSGGNVYFVTMVLLVLKVMVMVFMVLLKLD